MLENDPDIERIVRTLPNADEIFHVRDKMSKRVQETMNEDCESAITDAKYGFISGALKETFTDNHLEQVPDTLALQVIDCDMCDEIRTVYSLSGGESFLISLALALGLSSLSSNNLKVESLFIDEGFGSLDAESLRTAMEALEQLQMQGRKIGVISHVQEMSERISVQVQVHKKVNGKSVLTVVG